MDIYTCELCKFTTYSRYSLNGHNHSRKHRRNERLNVYNCNCCRFKSHIKTEYEEHLKSIEHQIYSDEVYIKKYNSFEKKVLLYELIQFFKNK